ncbi:hypothetical protein CC80DRAFT_509681 [Byssothecium circinans]|uniref:Uncharacterized protein n=1 Tax=Byssothecium circinans TaxID=147558 RepID=A0A6A5TNQ9_9PLEO|nr:hypothetical protein CC80DRAFT_509681 [Byssothecium circinans]
MDDAIKSLINPNATSNIDIEPDKFKRWRRSEPRAEKASSSAIQCVRRWQKAGLGSNNQLKEVAISTTEMDLLYSMCSEDLDTVYQAPIQAIKKKLVRPNKPSLMTPKQASSQAEGHGLFGLIVGMSAKEYEEELWSGIDLKAY